MNLRETNNIEIKRSIYNILVNYNGKDLLAYNVLSEKLVKCEEKVYRFLDGSDDIEKCSLTISALEKLEKYGFIVPKTADEFLLAKYRGNKNIYGNEKIYAMILPTNACNFNCVYCPQETTPSFITKDVCDSIISFILSKARFSKGIHIEWFGGEPLLSKDIIEYFMDRLKEKVKKSIKTPIISSMTTNGYLLDWETLKTLKGKNILYYQVTLDGVEKRHNHTRPLKNGGGTYKKILDNLIMIKENANSFNFKIVIRMNIDKTFFQDIEEFVSICKKYFAGDQRFVFLPKLITDLGGDKINAIRDQLVENTAYITSVKDAFEEAGLLLFNDLAIDEVCYASNRESYVFNFDGKIYKCNTILSNKNVNNQIKELNHIGTLNANGYVLDERKVARWIDREPYSEHCKKCKLFPICLGGRCLYAYKFGMGFGINLCIKEQEGIKRNIINLYKKQAYIIL